MQLPLAESLISLRKRHLSDGNSSTLALHAGPMTHFPVLVIHVLGS